MVFYKGGGGSFALLKQLKNKVTIGGNLSKGLKTCGLQTKGGQSKATKSKTGFQQKHKSEAKTKLLFCTGQKAKKGETWQLSTKPIKRG